MRRPPGTGFEATVRNVTFTGQRFRFEPGYYVTAVDGLGGAQPSHHGVPMMNGYGEFDAANQYEDARIITISGFAYDLTPEAIGRRRRRLDGLLAGRDDSAVLRWSEDGSDFRIPLVRRGVGSKAQRRVGAWRFADFTARFRAPDQRYFGQAEAFGPAQSITVSHWGETFAPLALKVEGNLPGGYVITHPAGIVQVTRPLATGHPHTFDMDTGLLSVDGVIVAGGLGTVQLWEVPPGAPGQVSVTFGAVLSTVVENTFM